jgi:nucleoside-diphosphate-sugar epimerase
MATLVTGALGCNGSWVVKRLDARELEAGTT